VATTTGGTPFKLATVQTSSIAPDLKTEVASVLRSTDTVIVLDDEVIAVMAGSPKEVQAGALRVKKALRKQRPDVDIRVEREPFKKRLHQTAERVIREEVPVHRRVQTAARVPQGELRRLYEEMRRQAWKAQQRVTFLEQELRRVQMELEMQKIANDQLEREQSGKRKRKFGLI